MGGRDVRQSQRGRVEGKEKGRRKRGGSFIVAGTGSSSQTLRLCSGIRIGLARRTYQFLSLAEYDDIIVSNCVLGSEWPGPGRPLSVKVFQHPGRLTSSGRASDPTRQGARDWRLSFTCRALAGPRLDWEAYLLLWSAADQSQTRVSSAAGVALSQFEFVVSLLAGDSETKNFRHFGTSCYPDPIMLRPPSPAL